LAGRATSVATTGRPVGRLPLPDVVTAAGSLDASPLLTSGDVAAVALAIAPPADGETEVQPRGDTTAAAIRYGIDLADLADRAGLKGKAGESYPVHLPHRLSRRGPALPWDGLPERIILLGVGGGSPTELRRAGAALARAGQGLGRLVTTAGSHGTAEGLRAFVEGYLLASYLPPTLATRERAPAPAAQLVLLGRHTDGDVAAARVTARAAWLARDLANTPSNTKNPVWLADRATALAHEADLEVEVWDLARLRAEGFGGILAVGVGSASEPRLVTVRYRPASSGGQHVVVVGKGITYDTGGLSIKPRDAMIPMKTDMTGAAVALAVVLGAAEAGLPHPVTAVLPLAENAFGASSYRPGDVLRLHDGRTVEITNTDAEGRIVLADALSYAQAALAPDVLIDVATLTGAASLGLGKQYGALYATDEDLASQLLAAGHLSGEPLWRMPLVAEYGESLTSSIADLRHVSNDDRVGGGSITAALFLKSFVTTPRWAHLDIAGPARAGSDSHEVTEGGTGFGARLLLRWLENLA
jgi:leucyl aminopeptidase